VDLNSPDAEDTRDFCFKCHRQEDAANKDGDVYTVNHIAFNKLHNTFVTSGSDGSYIIWNKDTKSRYKSSNKALLPVTCSNFSDDASILVFSSGEDWSLGGTAAKMR
jgi:WD40 repeat protein